MKEKGIKREKGFKKGGSFIHGLAEEVDLKMDGERGTR